MIKHILRQTINYLIHAALILATLIVAAEGLLWLTVLLSLGTNHAR